MDFSIFNWLDKDLNLSSNTNTGFKKTPIIWVGEERSFQIKSRSYIRDKDGVVILPVILLERTNITKDIKKKGKFFANILPVMDAQGGSITISKEIEQEKTRDFASSKMNKRYKQKTFKSFKPEDQNKQVVIVSKTIPLPIYILANYEITIRTNYQQEMNELVQPFLSFPGGINYFISSHERKSIRKLY